MTAVTSRKRSTGRLIGGAALAKIGVMGLSGVLGILTSKLIISHFGTAAYAQYGLLTSLPTLLPFADLGIAAVVINAIAGSSDPRTDGAVRRTITTAFRILLLSGAVIGLIGVIISVLGLWPALLGRGLEPTAGPVAALLCLALFGAVLPLTVGQRILVGLHRTTTQIASQVVVAPFILLLIGGTALLALPVGGYISIASYLASSLTSLICLVVAARALSPQVRGAIRDVPHLRRAPGVPVLAMSWPMLVQMLALPIAMQTDRLLISHLSTPDQLAQYNLASQIFGIVVQTINAAGIVLWPIFAKARADGRISSPLPMTVWFGAVGLALGLALAAVSPLLVGFVSSGRLTLSVLLVGGFVAFVVVQAAKYPTGMYMTDKRGLVFQVWPILAMVPLNLGLSWWLVTRIGAAGPIIGSVVSVLLCQLLPNIWWVLRDLRARRAVAGETSAA